ncbi:multidrug and toxin extrusion protein 2 isoform X4 [Eubalaena glacialis]|uniref:multidrug and toxin extrusion protein 2 isoform X4 n=1 Tax=Eubalaena glacialis TaxID=27606 RepID=UPI002A5A12E2|nr:multidrug and toxin extrusion protein 2 isoform X4 [Eubalaena glacialis]
MDGPQDMVPPGRGSRCPALRRLVPVGFGAEARTLFVLSGPLFLFQMLNFMTYVVSTVFCGHLGKVELAAVTLSVAFVNVCGVSIGFGLSSACDTLMSQSFGSRDRKHVGVILQRGALALLLCCLPCWALFLNTQPILLLCRQDPAVSRLAQEYVHAYIPALPPAGQISAKSGHHVAPSPQRRRGQLRQRAGQLHPGFRAGPGGQPCPPCSVRGSACANTVSQFTQAVFLLLCIVKKKLHLDTWAGLLSVLDLSAQAIIYEVATVVYMIPMGLSIAVCFRVGTALGAADTVQAKRSAVSGTLCTVGTSLVVGTVLSLLRNKLGHIFSNDEEVVALVSKVLPLYIVFHLFEAVCCLYGGVLRGTGRQAFGAVVNAVAYYVVGLPLGAVLTFVVGLGITGLWLGMLACVFLAAAAFVTSTAWMDWKRAAEEVQKRVGLPPQAAESTAPSLRPGPERAVISSVATGSYPGVTLTMYSRPEAHLDLFGTPEAAQPLPAPLGRLSAKQLAIRRGAALGAAMGTLVVGLVIRFLTARP